jgi:hypothetical protein
MLDRQATAGQLVRDRKNEKAARETLAAFLNY